MDETGCLTCGHDRSIHWRDQGNCMYATRDDWCCACSNFRPTKPNRPGRPAGTYIRPRINGTQHPAVEIQPD